MGLVKGLTWTWLVLSIFSTVVAGLRLGERMFLTSADISLTSIWRWFVEPPIILAAALALLGGIIATVQQQQKRSRLR